MIDLSAEDIVTHSVIEVLQRVKSPLRIYVSKCFWHQRLKTTNDLQQLLTTLHSEKTLGLSLSFSGLHNKLVRETLPGIIRLENLTSLDLSTNLLDFVTPLNRSTSCLQPVKQVLRMKYQLNLRFILETATDFILQLLSTNLISR